MYINTRGITRTVFVFKTFVVKIPKIRYGYRNFLRALLSNIDEGNIWNNLKYTPEIDRYGLFCPVIWHTKTGFILIMKRADVERHCEEMVSLLEMEESRREALQKYYKKWIDQGYGGDDKPDNYGYINNKLVKVDYQ